MIYRNYRYKVKYFALKFHLNSFYKELKARTRIKLASFGQSFFTDNPSLLAQKIPEILDLPLEFGLKCSLSLEINNENCHYIYLIERNMKIYSRQVHNWENKRKSGRYPKKTLEDFGNFWVSNIPCQRFFLIKELTDYFEVIP